MTAKELIKRLEQLDPNEEIFIEEHVGDYIGSIFLHPTRAVSSVTYKVDLDGKKREVDWSDRDRYEDEQLSEAYIIE